MAVRMPNAAMIKDLLVETTDAGPGSLKPHTVNQSDSPVLAEGSSPAIDEQSKAALLSTHALPTGASAMNRNTMNAESAITRPPSMGRVS